MWENPNLAGFGTYGDGIMRGCSTIFATVPLMVYLGMSVYKEISQGWGWRVALSMALGPLYCYSAVSSKPCSTPTHQEHSTTAHSPSGPALSVPSKGSTGGPKIAR